MKPINIYAFTRIQEKAALERFERQLSGRSPYLRIRDWEVAGLRSFITRLCETTEKAYEYEFYYSFTMPKLGKEFDLLRVNDDYVVNIEIKSRDVSTEAIGRQLLMNRYYLSTIGRTAYFYTYVSDTGRLCRLSNSGRVVEAAWEELAAILEKQSECSKGDIEDLFKEDRYLISPFTDPGRFLRNEYFLTNQQNDIRYQILKRIRQKKAEHDENLLVTGFTGLPGTGKTILLFDLAMQLSKTDKVCIFHMGSHERELEELDGRLKRIDFYYFADKEKLSEIKPYSCILVDEGHRMTKQDIEYILGLAKSWNVPAIFSYDREEPVSEKERQDSGYVYLTGTEGFIEYRLTNRIRLNIELSSFIKSVMSVTGGARRREYPSVTVVSGDSGEAERMIETFIDDGYMYIWDSSIKQPDEGLVFKEMSPALAAAERIEVNEATCKEFDKIVMLVDDTFFYDEEGYLRSKNGGNDRRVRNLFHGLSRAKERIAIVVRNNRRVFDVLLYILQGYKAPYVTAKGREPKKRYGRAQKRSST